MSLGLQIIVILVLLFANGVFAMTEIAIVSSRRGRLQAMAKKGHRGAAMALELMDHPNRFLSTVQIGITLVGIIAGAFGGARIAADLAEVLSRVTWVEPYAAEVAFVIVIGALTYLSLVIGELVPKRLAMQFPEAIASWMAGPMMGISKIAAPVVVLLSMSTSGLLRLFGARETEESRMSREDFRVLVREGLVAGNSGEKETRMLERIFNFENLNVYDIMIPQPRMMWIDQDARHEDVWPEIVQNPQQVFPVYSEHRDNLVGAVSLKEIYSNLAKGSEVCFKDVMHRPLLVPEAQKASKLLESFRKTGHSVAFVIDEFGMVTGMVTSVDLLESIVGDVPSREERMALSVRWRPDGTCWIDGLFEIEKLEEHLKGFVAPVGAGDEYQTVYGWFTSRLERLPQEGDVITESNWMFEVVDMDAHRVDKVVASRLPEPAEPAESEEPAESSDE